MQSILNALVAKLPPRAQRAAKAVVAATPLTLAAIADLTISGPEWRQIAGEVGAGVTAYLVYLTRNAK